MIASTPTVFEEGGTRKLASGSIAHASCVSAASIPLSFTTANPVERTMKARQKKTTITDDIAHKRSKPNQRVSRDTKQPYTSEVEDYSGEETMATASAARQSVVVRTKRGQGTAAEFRGRASIEGRPSR